MAEVKPEADALEQEQPVADDDELEEPAPVIRSDVPEADAVEQAQVVPGDLDEETR